MSTYYDLVCVEHGEEAGFHWNHGEEQLAGIARSLQGWAAIDPDPISDACHGVSWGAESGPSLVGLIEFAQRHKGCTVKPKDEYGRWYDQCRERIHCGECGKYDHCVLGPGHEGPCERST